MAPERSQRNAKSVSEVISGSEVVILATPWSAAESLVCEPAWTLADKILIDATNPLNPNASGLAVGFDTSGAEMLQSQAPEARVFKAFNSVGADVLANPRFAEGRAAMFVTGPEGAEKRKVMALVSEIGFDAVDAGPLKSARLLEPLRSFACLPPRRARIRTSRCSWANVAALSDGPRSLRLPETPRKVCHDHEPIHQSHETREMRIPMRGVAPRRRAALNATSVGGEPRSPPPVRIDLADLKRCSLAAYARPRPPLCVATWRGGRTCFWRGPLLGSRESALTLDYG